GAPCVARTSQGSRWSQVRPQKIQRHGALLWQPAGEVRPRNDGAVAGFRHPDRNRGTTFPMWEGPLRLDLPGRARRCRADAVDPDPATRLSLALPKADRDANVPPT